MQPSNFPGSGSQRRWPWSTPKVRGHRRGAHFAARQPGKPNPTLRVLAVMGILVSGAATTSVVASAAPATATSALPGSAITPTLTPYDTTVVVGGYSSLLAAGPNYQVEADDATTGRMVHVINYPSYWHTTGFIPIPNYFPKGESVRFTVKVLNSAGRVVSQSSPSAPYAFNGPTAGSQAAPTTAGTLKAANTSTSQSLTAAFGTPGTPANVCNGEPNQNPLNQLQDGCGGPTDPTVTSTAEGPGHSLGLHDFTAISGTTQNAGGYATGTTVSAVENNTPRNLQEWGFCVDIESLNGGQTGPPVLVPSPPASPNQYAQANWVFAHFGQPSLWAIDPAWSMGVGQTNTTPDGLGSFPQDEIINDPLIVGTTAGPATRFAAVEMAVRRILFPSIYSTPWVNTNSDGISLQSTQLANQLVALATQYADFTTNTNTVTLTVVSQTATRVVLNVTNGAGVVQQGVLVSPVAGSTIGVSTDPSYLPPGPSSNTADGGVFAQNVNTQSGSFTDPGGNVAFQLSTPSSGGTASFVTNVPGPEISTFSGALHLGAGGQAQYTSNAYINGPLIATANINAGPSTTTTASTAVLQKVSNDPGYLGSANATFTITGPSFPTGMNFTTNSTGQIGPLANLTPGTYIFHEVTPPAGQTAAPDQTVVLTSGSSTTVNFTDAAITGTLNINKTDAQTGKPLGGVTFDVKFDPNNTGSYTQDIGSFVTNSSGVATVPNLLPGSYQATETATPAGYVAPTPAIQTVTVAGGTTPTTLAFTDKLSPALVTTTSAQAVNTGVSLTDTITVSNTEGATLTGTWTLLGPVAPISNSCTGVSFAGAPTFDTGTFPVAGNGTVVTAASKTITTVGCYTYVESLPGSTGTVPVTTSPGAPAETTLVTKLTPSLVTTTSAQTVNVGATLTDSVAVSNTGGAALTGTWTLLGPVSTGSNGTCATANFAGAPTFDTGTFPVAGNGTVVTAASKPIKVSGCYTYVESLPSSTTTNATTTTPGAPAETTLVTPTLVTTASVQTVAVGGTLKDTVTVTGVGTGYTGTASYSLLGPVAVGGSGTCASANFTGAPTFSTGTLPITADGTYTTPASPAITVAGCYTYVENLSHAGTVPTTPTTPGTPTETILVTPTLVTTISGQKVIAGSSVTDTIVVSGVGNYSGPTTVTLYGPLAPVNNSCNGLNFTQAPVAGTTTLMISGNGTYTTAPVSTKGPGCYTFSESVPAQGTVPATTTTPGITVETTVAQTTPTLITTISAQTALVGTGVHDSITVQGTYTGTVQYSLLGPLTPVNGSCNGLTWANAPVAATGAVQATGAGVVTTPSTTINAAGCYTYTESIPSSFTTVGYTTTPGIPAETVVISPTNGLGSGTVSLTPVNGLGGTVAASPVTVTPAPSGGLAAITTDLGRWVPGGKTGAALIEGGIALLVAGGLVLLVIRRRRSAV